MPSEHTAMQVRPGSELDLEPLTDISTNYVRETAITVDTAPFTPEERRPRLVSHPVDGLDRLMVAQEQHSGRIPGYTTSSPFR